MASDSSGNYTYPSAAVSYASNGSQALFTALELAKDSPQHRRELMQKHGFRKSFYIKLKEMGLGSGVSGPVVGHYEDEWYKQTLVVGSITTNPAGAGIAAVITLNANSVKSQSIGGTTYYRTFAQVGDIVELPLNGARQKGRITAISAPTVTPVSVTIAPLVSTETLASKFTVGDRLFIVTNSYAEGTAGAPSRLNQQVKYENYAQIIKAAFKETGSSLTNQMPFQPIKGREGSFMLKGTEDTQKFLYDQISGALVFGQRSIDYDSNGNERRTTQGMVDYAIAEGSSITHTAGSITSAQYDLKGDIFENERINSDTIIEFMGSGYCTDMENALVSYLANTQIDYTGFKSEMWGNMDPKDYMAWIGFSGFKKNGYKYMFTKLDEFNDVQGAGATGHKYREMCISMPFSTLKNKGNQVDVPYLGYQYKELGGYSRELEVFKIGGAGPITKTESTDLLSCEFRSEIAFHPAMGSQWIVDKG